MEKTIIRILLGLAACALAYFCISSVLTPIKFEDQRQKREVAVVKNLIALRTAEVEFQHVNSRYTADLDSLVLFLQKAPKKEVRKEGSLTDKQLEAGLTEHKAVKIINTAKAKAQRKQKFESEDELYAYVWANDKEVISNGLQGFRRDTLYKNMIQELYKGEYTADNIAQITYIPYSNDQRFEVEVNNTYTTSQGIRVPLFEARAHFNTYLADLNDQERVNLIDKETKLEHYPGLKVGDIEAPNNNAGNWE
jgi:hypothetical protein